MKKGLENIIAYSRVCKSWQGQVDAKNSAKNMEHRLNIVNNAELNCFDKLRQIFACSDYELGFYKEATSGPSEESQKAGRMEFNYTVKLVNEVIKFDTMKKLEDKIIYSRNTDKYSATLEVEKYRMDLKVFEGDKLYLHRTAGDGIHIGEDLSSTEVTSSIRRSDLGALTFGDGGRGDVIELSYTFPEERYPEIADKFLDLLEEKGFTYSIFATQKGHWNVFTNKRMKRTMVMRVCMGNITLQHINEGIQVYNQFLKDEGLI